MRIDPNPLFRRIITPWYDSALVCWVIIVAMVILIVFSMVGIVVAFGYTDCNRFVKVPAILMALGFVLLLTVCLRLLRVHRHQKDE